MTSSSNGPASAGSASSPNTPPPHRLRRYRFVLTRLAPRLAELNVTASLRTLDGRAVPASAELSPAPPGGPVNPPSPVPAVGTSVLHAGALWIPLGPAGVEVYLRIEPAPGTSPGVLRPVAGSLQWACRDAERIFQLEDSTSQLGDRLSENYEQMHALFGLARLLDGTEDVRAGVQRVLDRIRAGLPFRWLAVAVSKHARLRPEIAGGFLLSGNFDRSRPDLEAVAFDVLLGGKLTGLEMHFPSDTPGRRAQPDVPPYADRLGTELIVAPVRYEGQVVGVLLAGDKDGTDAALSSFETQFVSACTDLLSVFHENLTRFAHQRALLVGTVRALTSAIDAKHRYTRGHSERVALLARQMAVRLGLSPELVENYHLAGLLHDVGKIGVPEAILSKPTRLTDEEFELVKRHPRVGHDILRDIPFLDEVLPGVLHHHEAYDGRGYPDKLSGKNIPLVGRVLSLCDTFDAMSSSRSYRQSVSREMVLTEIHRCAGRQFDPELAELFLTLDFTEFEALFADHERKLSLAA